MRGTQLPENVRTHPVDDELFRRIYDSPSSLPGTYRWVTSDADVRRLEQLLGIPDRSIGAPLWVSGDEKQCPNCKRDINWLDIASSGLKHRHSRRRIAEVILGEQKYVNVEAPEAIEHVTCVECGASITGIRSFKCHNWAYAINELPSILEQVESGSA